MTASPPSTRMCSPLMCAASSDARNAIAAATVSGPRALSSDMMRRTSSVSAPSGNSKSFVIGVSIEPGHTALHRRPCFAVLDGDRAGEREHAALRRRVRRRPRMADERRGRRHVDDVAPGLEQRGDRRAAHEERAGEVDARAPGPTASSECSWVLAVRRMPATLARTSSRPCRLDGVDDARPSSHERRVARRRRRSSSAGPSLATSTPTTVRPRRRDRTAVARPMPDAAPVTIATRPSKRPIGATLERVLVFCERAAGTTRAAPRQARPTRRAAPRPAARMAATISRGALSGVESYRDSGLLRAPATSARPWSSHEAAPGACHRGRHPARRRRTGRRRARVRRRRCSTARRVVDA